MEAPVSERDQYKIVTLKNVDNEDFTFSVDNQPYLLKAGEVRNFPKFMAKLAVKHLIDKILVTRDPEGKQMANKAMREELALKIVVNEEDFNIPAKPTTDQIVDQMNTQSDLDAVLDKQKNKLAKEATLIPPPAPVIDGTDANVLITETPANFGAADISKIENSSTTPTEQFDGLALPPRGEMLSYAEKTLKLNLADKKTMARFDTLTDDQLYKELGMNQEAE